MNYLTKKYDLAYLNYLIEDGGNDVYIIYHSDIELLTEIQDIEAYDEFLGWDSEVYSEVYKEIPMSDVDLINEFKLYMDKKKVLDTLDTL